MEVKGMRGEIGGGKGGCCRSRRYPVSRGSDLDAFWRDAIVNSGDL
jgi:hypothetical protein